MLEEVDTDIQLGVTQEDWEFNYFLEVVTSVAKLFVASGLTFVDWGIPEFHTPWCGEAIY